MAKFGSYFGLCPLIDHRSLLGISEDSENGKVLVTLGRNMAMQYKLADQKQILSWTTKEKFTSPVIFDFEIKKYVAVFNQMYIRCWDDTDPNLDKVKKFKFKKNVNTIIKADNSSFVIFQNGFIIKLSEAISKHRTFEPEEILKENEYVVDVISCASKGDTYIGLLVGNSDSGETSHLLWTIFDDQGNTDNYSQLKLKKDSCELSGITFHLSDTLEILTVWSDGKFYVKSIDDTSDDLGEVFSVIESISCKHPVSIVSLDKDYIAIYGGNSNQEGALLVIYNMQFKVTQCRQPFKLLTIGAKLWSIQEKLILPVGQNLAVVPYHLEIEQLSALVGSHKVNPNNSSKDVFIVHNMKEVNWSKENKIPSSEVSNDLKKITEAYLEQGFPECTIFEEVVSKYIEKNDIKSLDLLLKTFDDIPDKYFVELLQYFLEVSNKVFRKSGPHSSDLYPENLQPYKRYEMLIMILKKPINEIALIPYLRTKLNLNNVLKLLSFISFLLVDDIQSPNVNFTNKLLEWICLILDSNYQTFLLSKDENVMKVLLSFSELVNNELLCLEELQKLLSVVQQVSKKKKIAKLVESSYNVEKIDLS